MNDQSPIKAPQTSEDQEMANSGITAEQKTLYHYEGYVYERLSDALAYARIDAAETATRAQTHANVREPSGHEPPR